jgi:integrase
MGKLTNSKIDKLEPGLKGDGGGLYIETTRGADGELNRCWIRRWKIPGTQKQRKYGLGAYDLISITAARKLNQELAVDQQRGVDITQRRRDLRAEQAKAANQKTLAAAAGEYVALNAAAWSSAYAADWKRPLEIHVFPHLGRRPVASITEEDCETVLRPIWADVPKQADIVRLKLELIFDLAIRRGWVPEGFTNPAKNVADILPKRTKHKVEHHESMKHKDVPAFLRRLRACDGTGARAFEMLVLTAKRPGEILGARFDEIDLETGLWTIPGERMKGRKEHRLVLSSQALAIVKAQKDDKKITGPYVFPGKKNGKPLGASIFTDTLYNLGVNELPKDGAPGVIRANPHGFRTSFKVWARERLVNPDIIETALAHELDKTAVGKAYGHVDGRPVDLLELRTPVLQSWADYCYAEPTDNVTLLRAAS